jgi:hypothetical protein
MQGCPLIASAIRAWVVDFAPPRSSWQPTWRANRKNLWKLVNEY